MVLKFNLMPFTHWSKLTKAIIYSTSIFVGSEVMWNIGLYIHKTYFQTKKKLLPVDEPIAEVFFFSESICKSHASCFNESCVKADCAAVNLNKILKYILAAKESLDICVYMITNPEIAKAIIDAKRNDVEVRIIIDNEADGNDASLSLKFRREGIELRNKKSENSHMMHHKFAIVDKKVLVAGSANWTKNAFFGNFENVMVTNQIELVNKFIEEFEKLWESFA